MRMCSNDALRARGIIPKLPTPPRTPSPERELTSRERLEQQDDLSDDDLLDLEDDLPAAVLDSYRQQRMKEFTDRASKRKFGGLREISREDYTREITEASKQDMDEKQYEGQGTGVICFLYKES